MKVPTIYSNLISLPTLLAVALLTAIPVTSRSADRLQAPAGNKTVAGHRQYSIIVNQTTDTLQLNKKLRHLNSNRGILMDLAAGYLSLGTSTVLSASKSLVDMGIGMIKEAARDKRPDWEKAVKEESVFVKFLPMQTQVLDFYGQPSSQGALDPTDMKFSGFGCTQSITVMGDDGNHHEEEVFYLSCSVRQDDAGLARMLNHSKFEVQVDELRFNPWLCNLPNDSVNPNPATRIEFSFDKRKNLRFNVDAILSSSWLNEAIQVHDNVELGRFHVSALIDPGQLDDDGVFRYSREKDADSGKAVSVTGDSFLVPRSYVGSSNMTDAADSWGTGQYKVNMVITESCQINEDYYTENKNGKRSWKKERWNPEWKLIQKRQPRQSFWSQVTNTVVPQFTGETWITTLTEPFTTVVLNEESDLVKKASSKLKVAAGQPSGAAASGSTPQSGPAAGNAAAGASKGNNPQGNGAPR